MLAIFSIIVGVALLLTGIGLVILAKAVFGLTETSGRGVLADCRARADWVGLPSPSRRARAVGLCAEQRRVPSVEDGTVLEPRHGLERVPRSSLATSGRTCTASTSGSLPAGDFRPGRVISTWWPCSERMFKTARNWRR